ncbi:hypothetical protein EI94DRAFT_1596475, partial [Lactarius quietus]
GTPSLSTVIPAMDHIDKVLATSSDSPDQFNLAIRAALAISKKAMNQYYDKMDQSEVYQISMVLHPCHKLEYFKKQKWEVPWIQDAWEIVCREFDNSYAPVDVCSQRGGKQVANSQLVSRTTSHLLSRYGLTVIYPQTKNIFDNLPDLAPMSSELSNELDRYLSANIEDTKDALM